MKDTCCAETLKVRNTRKYPDSNQNNPKSSIKQDFTDYVI